jgi:hypothetical protein
MMNVCLGFFPSPLFLLLLEDGRTDDEGKQGDEVRFVA